MTSPLRRMILLFLAFLVCAAILGTLIYRKYQLSREVTPSSPTQTGGAVMVTLFFVDPEGGGLKREIRELEPCEGAACIESLLEELANGPVGELEPSLPETFSFKEARLVQDVAVIDLDKGSEKGLPNASSAEMAAVFSIVNSIAYNFQEVKTVRFLMEGNPMVTFKGHLDLREPVSPDFTLER